MATGPKRRGRFLKTTKHTFWAITAFYLLIAFDFFDMASPFALYFYSVYGPGLNFVNSSPTLAWLSSSKYGEEPHSVADKVTA